MRYLTAFLVMGLIAGLDMAKAQKIPGVVNVDSVKIVNPENITVASTPGNISNMPILDFPPEAKIRRWWPDTGKQYFMPNVLGSETVKKPKVDHLEK